MSVWKACAEFIASHGKGAMVRITHVEGSAPREIGAAMAVRADGAFSGTIGGGALEWRLLAQAQHLLMSDQRLLECDYVLGPELGQCCGGRVTVQIEVFDVNDHQFVAKRAHDEARSLTHIALFGAGHVGRALVLALAPLPFKLDWFDGRDDAFPHHVPQNVTCHHMIEVDSALAKVPADAFVLIMTHDHGCDLALARAALSRFDLGFVGLIGSRSKAARFKRRLQAGGLSQEALSCLVCPIGLATLRGKSPAVIAAGVVVQLLHVLQEREAALSKTDGVKARRRPALESVDVP